MNAHVFLYMRVQRQAAGAPINGKYRCVLLKLLWRRFCLSAPYSTTASE
jgi:hypothetical protein